MTAAASRARWRLEGCVTKMDAARRPPARWGRVEPEKRRASRVREACGMRTGARVPSFEGRTGRPARSRQTSSCRIGVLAVETTGVVESDIRKSSMLRRVASSKLRSCSMHDKPCLSCVLWLIQCLMCHVARFGRVLSHTKQLASPTSILSFHQIAPSYTVLRVKLLSNQQLTARTWESRL